MCKNAKLNYMNKLKETQRNKINERLNLINIKVFI